MTPKNIRHFKYPVPVPVLDKGYVLLIETMGDDQAVVDAARVSYAAMQAAQLAGFTETKKVRDDRGLLRYLLRSRHTSPFEQAGIKFEIKLPIFVERQMARHRTASWNEVSGRYSVLPNEFYFPEPESVRAQSKTNKQGRDETLPDWAVMNYLADLTKTCSDAYAGYERALESGVARELARCLLPVNIYTSKVWTMDLHNLLHFLALRLDTHAQKEIRDYAEAIASIVKVWVPWTWEAFEDYRLNSMTLTRQEIEGLRAILTSTLEEGQHRWTPDNVRTATGHVPGGRELQEFTAKIKRLGIE